MYEDKKNNIVAIIEKPIYKSIVDLLNKLFPHLGVELNYEIGTNPTYIVMEIADYSQTLKDSAIDIKELLDKIPFIAIRQGGSSYILAKTETRLRLMTTKIYDESPNSSECFVKEMLTADERREAIYESNVEFSPNEELILMIGDCDKSLDVFATEVFSAETEFNIVIGRTGVVYNIDITDGIYIDNYTIGIIAPKKVQ